MSIAPCQVCGGSGFILQPRETPLETAPAEGVHAASHRAYNADEPVPDDMEMVPCPICSASGINTGL